MAGLTPHALGAVSPRSHPVELNEPRWSDSEFYGDHLSTRAALGSAQEHPMYIHGMKVISK
jgi:hypothetical protein